jgi:hypothetical protein
MKVKVAKRGTTKRTSIKESTVTVGQMVDTLMLIPELAEAYSRADLELALEDRGWLQSNQQSATVETDIVTRRQWVLRSRMYWQRDPLAKQAVRLWTDYALGNGITFQTDEEGSTQQTTAKKKKPVAVQAADAQATGPVQKRLNKFWKDRRNRRMLNSAGQRRLSKKLLVDGELFCAVFLNKGTREGEILRTVDPLQITDFICDPDDDEHILAYRRLLPNNKSMYYADWTLDESELALAEQQKCGQERVVLQKDVVIHYLPFDTLNKRGDGLLVAALDWTREHRRFMEARVAIVQALAKFAWKGDVKGGQAALTAIQKRLASSISTDKTINEKNPAAAAGSTWLQNAGLNLDPMSRVTGAGDAKSDGDQFKLMVSAATGIMLHYFGDPSTGNLATSVSMELPMLKQFGSYQQLWKDFWRDVFTTVLAEDVDAEPAVIDIDLPPIVDADITKLGTALSSLLTALPELKQEEVCAMVLTALGLNNVDEIMKKVIDSRTENKEQQAKQFEMDNAKAAAIQAVSKSGLTKESAVALTEALARLSAVLGGDDVDIAS